MAISIKNLDAPLGAEIDGIDVSKPLPQADIDMIEAAWRERLVVVFHRQNLTDPQLIAFSKNLRRCQPLSEGFSHFVTSTALRLLPAGAFAGRDLHSLESAALSRRTPQTNSCAAANNRSGTIQDSGRRNRIRRVCGARKRAISNTSCSLTHC